MFKSMLIASLATASFIPSLASAQPSCQEHKHNNRVIGTLVGAGLGALLGNVVGEHGGKTGGTIIGGVGGAVAGNVIGAAGTNCNYDNRYSNGTAYDQKRSYNGYEQRNSGNGNRYQRDQAHRYAYNQSHTNRFSYYDRNRQWMPNTTTAKGYYNAQDRWVATDRDD